MYFLANLLLLWSMREIKAVIFDCDGIVVDSDGLQRQAEQETAAAFAELHGYNYSPDEFDWDEMQGWARKKIAANLFGLEVESDRADEFRLAVVATTVDIACAENTPLVSGIVPFVDYMAMRGLQLGLATASNRLIYTKYCDINGMDFFPPQYIVTHGESRDDKPKPGPFLEVMRRMNVAPENTLIIEDSSSGIMAGRFAGALVLGVATTKSYDYLRAKTDAQLVATDFRNAAFLLQQYLLG